MASIMDRKKYRTQHRHYSALLDPQKGSNGTSYDRKQVLEFLNENSDNKGFLTKKCNVLAEDIGMSYQKMSMIISEFIEVGYMKKYGYRRDAKFQILYHPDDCDWGPEWFAKAKEVRQKMMGKDPKEGEQNEECN